MKRLSLLLLFLVPALVLAQHPAPPSGGTSTSSTADAHAGQQLQAQTFVSSADAGTPAVVVPSQGKICLDNGCVTHLSSDGGVIELAGATVTTPDGLSLSPTRTDTASSYTANATSGNIAIQVANGGAKICLSPAEPNLCFYKNLSSGVTYFPTGIEAGAGQNLIYDSWFPKQSTVAPVVQGNKGLRVVCISAASLGTCGAAEALESTTVDICASAGVSRTRKCQCTSDGSGSSAWVTLTPGVSGSAVGTTTTCPVVPP